MPDPPAVAQGELEIVPASRQIVNHVSEAIISADQSNTIVMANPAAAALFGTTVDQMVGSPLGRYIEGPADIPVQAPDDAREPVDFFRPGAAAAPPITRSPGCATMASASPSKARSRAPIPARHSIRS